jgi:transcriptional regulator with PAS, ATPase and Fis domain
VVERTVLLSTGEAISADDLNLAIQSGEFSSTEERQHTGPLKTLEETEKDTILRAMEEYGDNLTKVAKKLDISRATLYRKMEKFGIRHGHEE